MDKKRIQLVLDGAALERWNEIERKIQSQYDFKLSLSMIFRIFLCGKD